MFLTVLVRIFGKQKRYNLLPWIWICQKHVGKPCKELGRGTIHRESKTKGRRYDPMWPAGGDTPRYHLPEGGVFWGRGKGVS